MDGLAMPDVGFLHGFPALRSGDPDQVKDWLKPVFAVRDFDMPRGERRFDSVINHHQLANIGLTYAHYGAALSARLQQNECFLQGFPVSGAGEVQWNRQTVSVSTASGGIVGGPGSEARFCYDDGFSHLIVAFSPAVLTRKLSSMIGRPIAPPLRLNNDPAGNPAHLAGQWRLVRFLAQELDQVDGPLPRIALEEIEQAIVVAYLVSHSHNYSHWLSDTPSAAAPWQVRSAADYIEQNWDQPITIEVLSHVTRTSARSLFHLFRRTYGISPMMFARRVRLQRARTMLSNPTPETTVTSVGFLCGFSNLGNFARLYFDAFGERPSDTLKSCR